MCICCDGVADWELWPAATSQHQERVSQHVASPGKNQNSKFEVQFLLNAYHYHTIIKSKSPKSNHHKLNHHKLGTVCI